MRRHPAIPVVLAVFAISFLSAPARAQVQLAPVGISSIDEPAASQQPSWMMPSAPLKLAQPESFSPQEPPIHGFAGETYAAGNWEFQTLAGGYFKSSLGPLGPDFDYLPISVRVGYQWTSPRWQPALLGSVETLLEVTAAPIASGPGNFLAGPSLLVRRNFVWRPDQCCVPYIQGGAGILFTDAGNDTSQGAIGQDVEFLLQAQIGLRTRLSQNWTFDIEGGFQHISNGGLAAHNGGVNNFGGSIGFTYTLPWRRR